jgi:hypothetical protein
MTGERLFQQHALYVSHLTGEVPYFLFFNELTLPNKKEIIFEPTKCKTWINSVVCVTAQSFPFQQLIRL